jgi:predicted ester cyclase
VGLAGTFAWAAWEISLGAYEPLGPVPSPPLLASWGTPTGGLLAALSRALSNAWRRVAEENRCKARRLYEEGLGRGDLSVVDELSSEDFRDLRHGVSGGQGMRRVVLALRESFPDLAVSIEEQEAKEDVVRTRLRLSGTDRGGVLWFMPTGRRATFLATFEDCFLGGRLVEHNGSTDTEGLLRQLGHPKEEELPSQ